MSKDVQQLHEVALTDSQSGGQRLGTSGAQIVARAGAVRARAVLGPLRRISDQMGLLLLSFLLCVVLPTLIGAFYVLVLAPKEYVAEFRVVVREATQGSINLPNLLSSALSPAASMFSPQTSDTTQNAYMISDYVKSRNMISVLGGKPRMFEVYSAQKGGEFSSLSSDATLEEIWDFWQSKIRTQVNSASGILTVQVRAYTPVDALRLANTMISLSEKMVNDVSDRSRADTLRRAALDVDRAQSQVVTAHQALLTFRNGQQVIDPAKEAVAIGSLISGLLQEKMTLEDQRAAMGPQVSNDSPVVRLMASRRSDIDRQVANLKDKLTAHNANPTISSQLATYETLQLRSQFAEQMYAIARSALESAREAKENQQLYLMTVVKPSLPDRAFYPRRAADIFLVFGLCLILWSIAALLTAAVLDHVN